jgi:hypothetical protein
MALTINKPAAATLIAAAFSMLAAPAAAVELPRTSEVRVLDTDAMDAEQYRRWRGRDRVDTGDVIAGVLILGGIAAIASAASRNRERDMRYPARYPGREPRGVAGYDSRTQSRGIDRAVDMCVAELERGRERVASVESAGRTGQGWHVAGELAGGESFACWIGNDGRISDIDVGGYQGSYTGDGDREWADRQRDDRDWDDGEWADRDDRQWDDADYARVRGARERQGGTLSGPPPLPEDYDWRY